MARKTERRHAQGEASRKTILDATLRIASERGYVGTTLTRVERAAGVSGSSVYWHFRSKDELLVATLDHGWRLWREQVKPWHPLEPHEELAGAILANLRRGMAYFDDEPGFWRIGLLLSLETGPAVPSGPRDRFVQIRAQALQQFQSWWQTALGTTSERSRRLALFTLATLDGLFIRHQSSPTGDLDGLLRLVAEGLAALGRAYAASPTGRIHGLAPASPPPPPLEAEPTSSRLRLLDAAHRLAAESGYEGATVSRICAAAGLPASSLYWQFKGKDDLFAEALDHSYRRWSTQQQVWQAPYDGLDWRAELHRHLLGTATSLIGQPPFLRLGYLLVLLRRQEPPLGRDRFIEMRSQRRRLVAEWWRAATGDRTDRPELVAQLAMAVFDGLHFYATLDGGAWEPAAFADLMLCFLTATAPSAPAAGTDD